MSRIERVLADAGYSPRSVLPRRRSPLPLASLRNLCTPVTYGYLQMVLLTTVPCTPSVRNKIVERNARSTGRGPCVEAVKVYREAGGPGGGQAYLAPETERVEP